MGLGAGPERLGAVAPQLALAVWDRRSRELVQHRFLTDGPSDAVDRSDYVSPRPSRRDGLAGGGIAALDRAGAFAELAGRAGPLRPPPQRARRHASQPLERAAERGFRLVAQPFGHLGNAE